MDMARIDVAVISLLRGWFALPIPTIQSRLATAMARA
jgi:hypothetical protein